MASIITARKFTCKRLQNQRRPITFDPAAMAVTTRNARQGDHRASTRAHMSDVAELAGVSTSTVSRTLRNPDTVSRELRHRVESAIATLSYVPNSMAGGLAASRTRTVGVIVPSLVNSFFAATIEAMTEALGIDDYQILLGNSGYDIDREEALVNSFLSWSPAAIVLTGQTHSRTTLQRLINAGVPIVEMWELGENPLDSLVGFSHRAVGRAAARHLLRCGCRRMAFIGAALERDRRANQRGAGFSEAVIETGLPAPESFAITHRASVEQGGKLVAELLSAPADFDGIFFSNDVLMLGGLFECQRRAVEVPGQLRMIGFGDLDFAAWTQPSMTTIRPPRHEIGAIVARLLLQRFRDAGAAATTIDVGFEVVERESA
jgi:LacI family gluconate utilization system Gnt-I transcriptional repressor